MKLVNKIIDILIIFLVAFLFFNIGFKIGKKRENINQIRRIIDTIRLNNVRLIGLDGRNYNFFELIDKDESYILFFKLSNCPPCIYKGINKLRQLQWKDKSVASIVIHDWPEEWIQWTKNIQFESIYLIKEADLGETEFHYLPILIKFNKGKATNFQYVVN